MNWFKDLSMLTKLISGFVIVALISALVGVIGIRNIENIIAADKVMYEQVTVPLGHVAVISTAFQRMRNNSRDIIMTNDIALRKDYRIRLEDRKKEIDSYSEQYERLILTDAGKKTFKKFRDNYQKYIILQDSYLTLDAAGRDAEAIALMNGETELVRKESQAAIEEMMTQKLTIGQMSEKENSKNGSAAVRAMVIIILLSIGFSVGLGFFIARLVTGPVNMGLNFARKIAAGDFTERIKLDQKDELGQLGAALNTAADDLEKMVADIIYGAQNLVQAIQEISAGNENLSQRTSEQASSLEEIASTIEETTASINQNAENSKTANVVSIKTSALAEEGGRVVYEAGNAILEINDASKKIEEITGVINDIAFQTNLLALNAAVEAARAGEQGRGFAVVAGEVRNLAQRSGVAAKEIGALIKSTISKVEKGTNLANKSGDALKETIASVKIVSRYVSEIAAASEEQQQGAAQINVAVSELDSMTQQNAGLVEETASASEEIANQAQELLAIMERFKIRDRIKKNSNETARKEIHHASAKTDMRKMPAGSKTQVFQKAELLDRKKRPEKIEKILSDEGFQQF